MYHSVCIQVQEKSMEPRLNVNVADLFTKTAADEMGQGPDVNFQDPSQQWLGDFVNNKSDYQRNQQAYDEYKSGEAAQIDRDNAIGMQNNVMSNPAQDRALMVMEPEVAGTRDLQLAPVKASKFASQSQGFRRDQAYDGFTMGIVANINTGTIVNSRVVAETPNTKIAGTVIAVGDSEFAVVWDDKTASVERKGDYELVIAQ